MDMRCSLDRSYFIKINKIPGSVSPKRTEIDIQRAGFLVCPLTFESLLFQVTALSFPLLFRHQTVLDSTYFFISAPRSGPASNTNSVDSTFGLYSRWPSSSAPLLSPYSHHMTLICTAGVVLLHSGSPTVPYQYNSPPHIFKELVRILCPVWSFPMVHYCIQIEIWLLNLN